MKLYKGISLLLAAGLLCLCTGCGETEKAPVQLSVVLKTPVSTAEFWEETMKGVELAAEDFGMEVSTYAASGENRLEDQIEIMEEVLKKQPDYILLSASDYDRLAPITERAVEQGISVVTMDSDVNTEARSCFVASNNRAIGRMLADEMKKLIDTGEVAVLTHSTMSTTGRERASGATESLSGTNLKLLGVYDCQNNVNTAARQTAELIRDHPNLKGIICCNEICNVGAARQLIDQELEGAIKLVGCDNSKEQIQYLERGTVQAIVIQKPFTMGYAAVRCIDGLERGADVPDFVEIKCLAITKETMFGRENRKALFPFDYR